MTSKELRERRAPLAAKIRELADKVNAESRDFSAEETAAWEAVNKDYNALSAQIERAERAEAVEAEQAARVPTPAALPPGREDRTGNPEPVHGLQGEALQVAALQGWLRFQSRGEITDTEADACRAVGLMPTSKEIGFSLCNSQDFGRLQAAFRGSHPTQAVRRATDIGATLSGHQGPSGGYLVMPTMVRQLEINMLAYGGMLQVAEVITTATGERLAWPTADDTSNTGAQLGESTSIGSSVDPSFGQVYWDAYKFSSKPILVPYELLEDSAFNLPSILGDMLGERLGRIQNTKFTTGTGAGTPKGITLCSSLGVTTATATAITADEIINLVHSVDPAYRNGAGFMMNDGIVLYIRKLKDGDGQYLWQPGMTQGVPDRIYGYPLTVNQDMQSSVVTATKTMLFGQLNKYKIRRVNGVRLYRLQERYRDTDQDGFVAFIRADGNLLTAGTAPVKHMLQA